MTDMLALLDRPAFEVFEDRAALDRLAQAMCLDRPELGYAGVLDVFVNGWEHARQQGKSGETVAKVLEAAGFSTGRVGEDVKLLERRDTAVRTMLDVSVAPMAQQDLTPRGEVKLPADADMGKLLANREERERRLARMRKLDPAGLYEGEQGRERFEHEDRRALEGGIDIVATAERPRQVAQARAQAAEFSGQIDAAMGNAREAADGVRKLDEQIAELQARRGVLAGGAARTDHDVKILEQAATGRTRTLDSLAVEYGVAHGLDFETARAHVTTLMSSPAGRFDPVKMLESAPPADVAGRARPLLGRGSAITRSGFHTLVKQHQREHGTSYEFSAGAVAKKLAPDVGHDELRGLGLLDEPKD